MLQGLLTLVPTEAYIASMNFLTNTFVNNLTKTIEYLPTINSIISPTFDASLKKNFIDGIVSLFQVYFMPFFFSMGLPLALQPIVIDRSHGITKMLTNYGMRDSTYYLFHGLFYSGMLFVQKSFLVVAFKLFGVQGLFTFMNLKMYFLFALMWVISIVLLAQIVSRFSNNPSITSCKKYG